MHNDLARAIKALEQKKKLNMFLCDASDLTVNDSGIQGRPPLRLQNSYQFKVQKTNPKTSLLDLLVLIMTTCPFLLFLMQEVACFKSLQSRRFEARRGLGEARRGLGKATPRTQNVLAQGQSEAHGDSKLYNTIVEVPGRLNLK